RSLLVALDRGGRPHRRVVGILPGGAAGPALAPEVPALVQRHLDPPEAVALGVRSPATGEGLLEVTLPAAELTDRNHDLLVVHRDPPWPIRPRPDRRYPAEPRTLGRRGEALPFGARSGADVGGEVLARDGGAGYD